MTVRLFVNEQTVTTNPKSTILTAVMEHDPSLGSALRDGRAYVTDGVGIEIDPATLVSEGAILRVVVSARRSQSDESTE